jgi:hypothetical protein
LFKGDTSNKIFFIVVLNILLMFGTISTSMSYEIIRGKYCNNYRDEERLDEVKNNTKILATRNAIEQYIYWAFSQKRGNFSLTDNEIQNLTSGYFKKMKSRTTTSDQTVCCDVQAFVDPKPFEKALQEVIVNKRTKPERTIGKGTRSKASSVGSDEFEIVDVRRIDSANYSVSVKALKNMTRYAQIDQPWVKCFDGHGILLAMKFIQPNTAVTKNDIYVIKFTFYPHETRRQQCHKYEVGIKTQDK